MYSPSRSPLPPPSPPDSSGSTLLLFNYSSTPSKGLASFSGLDSIFHYCYHSSQFHFHPNTLRRLEEQPTAMLTALTVKLIYISTKYASGLSVLPNNPVAFSLWIQSSALILKDDLISLLSQSLISLSPPCTVNNLITLNIAVASECTTCSKHTIYRQVCICTLILCFYPVLISKASTCTLDPIPSYLLKDFIHPCVHSLWHHFSFLIQHSHQHTGIWYFPS